MMIGIYTLIRWRGHLLSSLAAATGIAIDSPFPR
jgi:hypothetical protein